MDWIVLSVYGLVWLSLCPVLGVSNSAWPDPSLVGGHLLVRLAFLMHAPGPIVAVSAVLIATVFALAWLLSRSPAIAIAACLLTLAGWIMIMGVALWSAYLEYPSPVPSERDYTAVVYPLFGTFVHIGAAWLLLLGFKWLRQRRQRQTA